jgi:Domain of unknown function (DUF1963)
MRRLALAGAIILIFAAVAAMAALGPFDVPGPGADLYRRAQALVDARLVAPLGRPVAGIAALVAGLAIALAIFLRRRPRAGDEAPAPRISIVPRRKPVPEDAEADAEAHAAAERRMAALRERSLAEPEPFAQPGPVLVLRQSRCRDGDRGDGGRDEARSWLGGLPRLGGQPWPMGRSSGQPLPFAAQIDLADLAAARPDSALPDRGSLAFFLGEGAVVYVPPAEDDLLHPRFPQAPASLAVRDGEEPFPADPSPLAEGTWPFWPVDLLPLDTEGARGVPEDEHAALWSAAGRHAALRVRPLDAAVLCRDCGIDPVPLWWHSVRLFTDGLRRARHHVQGEAELLDAAIAGLAWFAEGRDEAELLSEAERADFETMFAEIHELCADQVAGLVPPRLEDLATASLRAMASSPAALHEALPPALAAAIERDHRQPPAALHLMFGPADAVVGGQGDDLLLLQLASDDLMEWHFGEGGVFQFRISARDLAEGWLDRAELAFDRY